MVREIERQRVERIVIGYESRVIVKNMRQVETYNDTHVSMCMNKTKILTEWKIVEEVCFFPFVYLFQFLRSDYFHLLCEYEALCCVFLLALPSASTILVFFFFFIFVFCIEHVMKFVWSIRLFWSKAHLIFSVSHYLPSYRMHTFVIAKLSSSIFRKNRKTPDAELFPFLFFFTCSTLVGSMASTNTLSSSFSESPDFGAKIRSELKECAFGQQCDYIYDNCISRRSKHEKS